MPGSGASRRAGSIAPRDCGQMMPAPSSGLAETSKGPSMTIASGSSGSPCTGTPRSTASARSVFRRTESSGGSFWATITSSASEGPSISSHSRATQSGYECRRGTGSPATQSSPAAAIRRSTAFASPAVWWPATRLQSSTVSFTAACGGTPLAKSS